MMDTGVGALVGKTSLGLFVASGKSLVPEAWATFLIKTETLR